MEQEGWSIEPSIGIVNSLDRTIFKAGLATARKKMLANEWRTHSVTKLFYFQREKN
jgi:hypothetical protein